MTLRVLLIGNEAEELLFLQDVLREVEQERLLPEWPRVEPIVAATCGETERILQTCPPHAIVLDLAGSGPAHDNPPLLDAFRIAQSRAPDVPVVLLIETGGEVLASRLMREGAEDFLLRTEVDCAPLAHALRNAVVRHRVLSAARAGALIDPLTGLANRAAFLTLAERDRKLAERLGRRWMLLIATPRNLDAVTTAFGEQRRDLDLVEAAEHLRTFASPADMLARFDERHFAVSIFDNDAETVEEAWARIRSAAASNRIDVGAAIFDPERPLNLDSIIDRARTDLPVRESRKVGAA